MRTHLLETTCNALPKTPFPLVLGLAIENPEMVGKIKLRFKEKWGERRMETVYQDRYRSQTLFCNPFFGDFEAPCNFNKLIASHAAECRQGNGRATIQHYNC